MEVIILDLMELVAAAVVEVITPVVQHQRLDLIKLLTVLHLHIMVIIKDHQLVVDTVQVVLEQEVKVEEALLHHRPVVQV